MAHSHVYSWSISRIWKENTSFRNGKPKEELLRKIRKFRPGKFKQYRLRNGASRANWGFVKRRDGGRLKINVWSANLFGKVEVLQGTQHTNNYLKMNVWSANLFGKVEVLQGTQHTNNYRFDCGFVLKCFSNWPIFRIPNSYCKIFEKRVPHGPINRLENWLAISSNRLRGDGLAAKIPRFCFLGLYKGLCE